MMSPEEKAKTEKEMVGIKPRNIPDLLPLLP